MTWSEGLFTWTCPPERGELIPLGAPGMWDNCMLFTARAPVILGDRLYFYHGGRDPAAEGWRWNSSRPEVAYR